MKIIVNGKEENTDSVTLSEYIDLLKLSKASLIVEYNGFIIKPEDWSAQVLKENDKIEVLSFVGGG